MSANAPAARNGTRATHDFYALIHKGLRLAQSRLLIRLGSTDYANTEGVSALLKELRAHLNGYSAHLMHEDKHKHPVLEERVPGAAAHLSRQHKENQQMFSQLLSLAERLEAAAPQARPPIARELYLRFSLYVAHDFEHMAEEELKVLPQFQEHFTDAELQAIEARITTEMHPEIVMFNASIMIPAINQDERVALVSAFKAVAPPEAFQGVMQAIVRPSLTDAEWQNLNSRLGLPA